MKNFIPLVLRRLPRLGWPWLLAGSALIITLTCLQPLMQDENGIQIRANQQGRSLPDGFYVYQRLNEQGIHIKSITPDQNTLVIRFDSPEQSVAAERILRQILPYGVDIAPLTPPTSDNSDWISRIALRT